MKKLFMAIVVAACAIGAQADGDWKTTLGKVKDFSGDMGFMAFMKREAPAYISSIEVNREHGTVTKHGERVDVTKTELELLLYLIDHRGAPASTRALYENVWREMFLASSANTVMVHILKLRKKLEDDPANPKLIRTVWGKGYQID